MGMQLLKATIRLRNALQGLLHQLPAEPVTTGMVQCVLQVAAQHVRRGTHGLVLLIHVYLIRVERLIALLMDPVGIAWIQAATALIPRCRITKPQMELPILAPQLQLRDVLHLIQLQIRAVLPALVLIRQFVRLQVGIGTTVVVGVHLNLQPAALMVVLLVLPANI